MLFLTPKLFRLQAITDVLPCPCSTFPATCAWRTLFCPPSRRTSLWRLLRCGPAPAFLSTPEIAALLQLLEHCTECFHWFRYGISQNHVRILPMRWLHRVKLPYLAYLQNFASYRKVRKMLEPQGAGGADSARPGLTFAGVIRFVDRGRWAGLTKWATL